MCFPPAELARDGRRAEGTADVRLVGAQARRGDESGRQAVR
jgi:hypothetical protein